MPGPYWPHFLGLAAIVVIGTAAAMQAGNPQPWSWRRFGLTALVLAAVLSAAIFAGHELIRRWSEHSAMLIVCTAAVTIALLVTVLRRFGRGSAGAAATRSDPD